MPEQWRRSVGVENRMKLSLPPKTKMMFLSVGVLVLNVNLEFDPS
jgi:hypothetical protein